MAHEGHRQQAERVLTQRIPGVNKAERGLTLPPSPPPHTAPLTNLYFRKDCTLSYPAKLQWACQLSEAHSNYKIYFKDGRNRCYIQAEEKAVQLLTKTGYEGITLEEPDKDTVLTKVIIKPYPAGMSLQWIEKHDRVVWCQRGVFKGEERPYVICLWRGEIPNRLQFLPAYPKPQRIEKYIEPPVFCRKCCRYGHGTWLCSARARCGYCGANHPSKTCWETIQRGSKVTPKCANCFGMHNAWSTACPKRPAWNLHTTRSLAGSGTFTAASVPRSDPRRPGTDSGEGTGSPPANTPEMRQHESLQEYPHLSSRKRCDPPRAWAKPATPSVTAPRPPALSIPGSNTAGGGGSAVDAAHYHTPEMSQQNSLQEYQHLSGRRGFDTIETARASHSPCARPVSPATPLPRAWQRPTEASVTPPPPPALSIPGSNTSGGGGSAVDATHYQQLKTQMDMMTQSISQLQKDIKELSGKVIKQQMGVSVVETTTREQSDSGNLDDAYENDSDFDTLDDQFQKERADTVQKGRVRNDPLDAPLKPRSLTKGRIQNALGRMLQEDSEKLMSALLKFHECKEYIIKRCDEFESDTARL